LPTFAAAYLQENGQNTARYTFAFHRAELVGAFFNGVFLLALALSIFLRSVERFVDIEVVDSPMLVLIVGCVGLMLNIASAFVVHDHAGHGHGHSHSHSSGNASESPHDTNNHSKSAVRNLGLTAVLMHLLGDVVNNIAVIISAAIMWRTTSPLRFYADPATSMAISLIILAAAIPITMRSGRILLEASPRFLDLNKIKEDLTAITGAQSIHDLHVWHLSQSVILASLHVCIPLETTLSEWTKMEQNLQRCFSSYGIGHVTISPEIRKSSITPSVSFGEDFGGCKLFSDDDFGCSVVKKTEI
jgi:zinc transporter 1